MNQLLAQGSKLPTSGPAQLKDLEIIFGNVVGMAIGATAIILFVYLLRGGLNYITSGGSPDKISAARNAITYAIYGVIFVALAFLILRVIVVLTGVEGILNFSISQ